MLIILSKIKSVVNYDVDNGWSSILSKFTDVPKISSDISKFYTELDKAKISLSDQDKIIGFTKGLKITNEEFLSFFK